MKIKTAGILTACLVMLLAGCAKAPAPAQTSAETTTPAEMTGQTETTAPAEGTFRKITMDEAITLMEDETGYLILDVRTMGEFELAHIPGAICIPNETIGEAEIPELPDKDQLILVYCRSGNRSKQAAEKLAQKGYTQVVEFGGIKDWPGETVSGKE